MRLLLAAALLSSAVPTALADPAPFAAAPLADDDLANMRGGFEVPGGIEVSLAVQMDAAVNGALVLRTVLRVEGNTPTLAVYAPAPGTTGPAIAGGAPSGAAGAETAPALWLTGPTGIPRIEPGSTVPTTVAVSTTGNPAIGAAPPGLAPLAVTVGGPAVQTAAGDVRLIAVPTGTNVQLEGMQLSISQVVGAAFLNLVANRAANRTIDTTTMLNIDLRNTAATSAAVGAARVADVVSQVAARAVR